MSSVCSLSDSERRRLKQLARRAVGRVSERIRMVLLASRGYSLAQIAAIFECEEATVKRWVERYQQEGESGLQDRPRSGRPRKADAVARSALSQAVEQTPAQLGYRFGYWTTVTLAAHLAQRVGICLSAATVRRALRLLTYVNHPGARGEIWAYGLRNPWRFSFDRKSKMLFAADVGQDKYEEVDIIIRGGNYGWRIMEGLHDYQGPAGANKSGLIAPIHEYNHDLGISVTGGYVYRGNMIPALKGAYVFGDYNGKSFVLVSQGKSWQRANLDLVGRPAENMQILSWGEDEQGELYMLTSISGRNGFQGAIYKLVKA